MREAREHLFARNREMRPLFLAPALPMKVEWKISPYLGVLPLVFRALNMGKGVGWGKYECLFGDTLSSSIITKSNYP